MGKVKYSDKKKLSNVKLTDDISYKDISLLDYERTGERAGSCEKHWVSSQSERYLFKENFKGDGIGRAYPTDVGEVLMTFLGEKVGMNVVKSCFASDVNCVGKVKKGILIEDFSKGNTCMEVSEIMRENFFRVSSGYLILKKIEKFADKFNLKVSETVNDDLEKLYIFDYLTFQRDRHLKNISILINETNDENLISLAPMYDNGFCFFFASEPSVLDRAASLILNEGTCENLYLFSSTPVYGYYDAEIAYSSMSKSDPGITFTQTYEKLLANAVVNLRGTREIYNAMKKLNFTKVLSEFEIESGHSFTKKEKFVCQFMFNERLNRLNREINHFLDEEFSEIKKSQLDLVDKEIKNSESEHENRQDMYNMKLALEKEWERFLSLEDFDVKMPNPKDFGFSEVRTKHAEFATVEGKEREIEI